MTVIDADSMSEILMPRATLSERLASWTFGAAGVVSFASFLVIGRRLWFQGDEWDFLAHRTLNLHGLFLQHGGHLVALPVIEYRALFAVFGLRSYLPYQVVVVALHVTTAALLRIIMRRSGVSPWIASAAAALFLFFGAGGQDILWAFQVTFVGSLVLGLIQLLLVDHDGRVDWRDELGLAMGFAAIACSGVGVTMVALAGVAALIRRSWRAGAFQALPPLAVWFIWQRENSPNSPTSTNVRLLFDWSRRGLESTFNALGQVAFVGWMLAAILVVGLALAVRSLDRDELRRRLALPAAFLAGVIALLVTTGVSRLWLGVAAAGASRYVYVVAALLLPPLALAADALVRRWRRLLLVVLVLLLVGIPGNMSKTLNSFPSAQESSRDKQVILSVARSPLALRVPRSLWPDPARAPYVTIGWLLDNIRAGRIPVPRPLSPSQRATNTLRLALEDLDQGHNRSCPALRVPKSVILSTGSSLVVHGHVAVRLLAQNGAPASQLVVFGSTAHRPASYQTLVADAIPLRLRIFAASKGASAC